MQSANPDLIWVAIGVLGALELFTILGIRTITSALRHPDHFTGRDTSRPLLPIAGEVLPRPSTRLRIVSADIPHRADTPHRVADFARAGDVVLFLRDGCPVCERLSKYLCAAVADGGRGDSFLQWLTIVVTGDQEEALLRGGPWRIVSDPMATVAREWRIGAVPSAVLVGQAGTVQLATVVGSLGELRVLLSTAVPPQKD